MHRILTLPEGAQVIRYGEHVGGVPILFIGRNQFLADARLRERLLAALSQRGFDVFIYERPGAVYEYRIRSKFNALPRWPRWILKGLLLLAQPTLWRHAVAQRRHDTIEFQKRSFRSAVTALGFAPIVVARSAGARVASATADELALSGLICLGYPFRNPDRQDEPDRYRHLAGLKTPCLIIQGDTDSYGGIEAAGAYVFSPSVRLEFLPTDHGMMLSATVMQRLLDLAIGFAESLPEPAA